MTYIAPLAFVLSVTMGKEAYDDYKRYLRDKEANSQRYLTLQRPEHHSSRSIGNRNDDVDSEALPEEAYLNKHVNARSVPSSSIRVGDLVHLEKNQRVPADMVLLHTSEGSGTCFIRTDQLDGETDWKLRVAVPETQKLQETDLVELDAEIYGSFLLLPVRLYSLILLFNSGCSDQGYSHFHRNVHAQQTSQIIFT